MRTIFTLFTLCLLYVSASAQNTNTITGSVTDTISKAKLTNATIIVLNAKDSILLDVTYAADNGAFIINSLPAGEFILLVTYPDYADYAEPFILDANHVKHDFGVLNMQLKAKLLQEVLIKGAVTAIKLKGDTTEFNANAYVIQPNDRVEDLIRQFPGIQVDKNGKITVQGQTVTKVLLDGEEFFGDDPTLVTRNIRADMVDKVQLFNKKSDQATFTGIDDGVKTKALNIKLKENKKNGYFGKADAGVGTDGYYQAQGLYNRFKDKEKFSAYVTIGNTGKTGLNYSENQKYTDNGFDSGSEVLNYNNQGIPLARTGGIHYDNKWNSDKQSINSNYRIGALTIDGVRNTLTQNNLPNGVININQDQTFHNTAFRQKLDITYQVKLDSTTNLKITADGTSKNVKSNTDFLTVSRRANDTLLNRNSRVNTNDADQRQFNASVLYTKKLKKGHTFSILFSEMVNSNIDNGYLKSATGFYNNMGQLDSTQLIDQYKTNNTKNTVFNSNITYSLPLTKHWALITNYGVNVNNENADKSTYNPSSAGVYNLLDLALSNYFKLDQLSNQAGAIFNYKKGKTIINFGTRAANVSFKQTDEFTGDVFKRRFINWYPQATYKYEFSQQGSIEIYYDGNTTQPSINQIQPVRNNTDPLNIYVGNQALEPSFTNRISLYYNAYKTLTNQFINVTGTFSFTSDPIISSITTNDVGKSTIQYINLSHKKPYDYNVGASISRKITGYDINIGLSIGARGSTYYAYSNDVLGFSNSAVYNGALSLRKSVQKKYSFSLSFGPAYNVNKSTLQKNTNSNGGGFNANGSFTIYLPGNFQVASDINYIYSAKTETFNQDLRRALWNAGIAKIFLKDNSLKFSLTGNDLLNQNIGFNRTAYGNTVIQNSYNTIKRYFMLSITWDFNHMGQAPANK